MKKFYLIILFSAVISFAKAQDLDSMMNAMNIEEPNYTSATFKATRIINTHSVEHLKERHLDFRIHHRFGPVNTGAYQLWGLDYGQIFLSFEYGIKDWITVGLGRTSEQKTYNGFTKVRILRQSSGSKNCPISLSLLGSTDIKTYKRTDVVLANSSRFSYVFQALIARKFNESFSIQITPSLIHQNLVETALDPNDVWSIAAGGRYKISKRVSLNAEYNFAIRPSYIGQNDKANSLSFGFDIETGGHVFQLMLTNTQGMIERQFTNNTLGFWNKGDVVLGFNVSRIFSFK